MRIFHNYINKSSFISQDEIILSEKFDVISFKFDSNYKLKTPLLFLKQTFYLLWYFRRYEIIFSHIAGYHTFIPSVFSYLGLKKHLIVLHGTECNVIEEIGYGLLNRSITRYFVIFSMRNASMLLPVSESLIEQSNSYLDKPQMMGLKSILGANLPRIQVIYNGIDPELFKFSNIAPIRNSFLTISSGLEERGRFLLKGVDLILKLAADFPECSFTIIGSKSIYGYKNSLNNVNIVDFIPNLELANYISRHQFYLQLSMSEGFGLSLCEAMLCGVTPIVSKVGIMPEIIGNTGYVLEKQNYSDLKLLVRDVLGESSLGKNWEASERIKKMYNFNFRKEKLHQCLKEITTPSKDISEGA